MFRSWYHGQYFRITVIHYNFVEITIFRNFYSDFDVFSEHSRF